MKRKTDDASRTCGPYGKGRCLLPSRRNCRPYSFASWMERRQDIFDYGNDTLCRSKTYEPFLTEVGPGARFKGRTCPPISADGRVLRNQISYEEVRATFEEAVR